MGKKSAAKTNGIARKERNMKGKVIYYNKDKGYGFIQQDENPMNLFFHITKCNNTPEEKLMVGNMRVSYDIAEGYKGIEAVNIKIIDDTPQG